MSHTDGTMCLSKLKALLEVGDLIEIVRTGYKHWGVYAGKAICYVYNK